MEHAWSTARALTRRRPSACQVRVWNSVLTWEEVREHMNVTLHGEDYPRLIGQWSLNEGAGELCADSSSRRNDGALEGDVARVLCSRDAVEAAAPPSEVRIDAAFERLRLWREAFEKREGREVTAADMLLADEDLRKTATRLGLLP